LLLETRVIEAQELTLQRRAADAELAVQAALIELNRLRGAPLDAPLQVSAGAVALPDAPETSTLLAAARENNFDHRMRQVELEQQGVTVRLARHERLPALSVSPFYEQEKAGERETVAGVGVSLPLPVTGRTRGAVDLAESRRRQAETALFLARRELERDVLTAAQAYGVRLAEARRWSPGSVARFRDAAALADRHYRLGAVPVATYVELQTSYLDAVEALLDTERDALVALLQLQQLTGLDLGPGKESP
jgi:cobalt-zinc-cadmium efflux system outer membrane protein